MVCPNCNAENKEGTRFCEYCGTAIQYQQSPVQLQQTQYQQPPVQPQQMQYQQSPAQPQQTQYQQPPMHPPHGNRSRSRTRAAHPAGRPAEGQKISKKTRVILFIAGLVILGFGMAISDANKSERVENIADQLVETTVVSPENEGKLIILSGIPQLVEDADVVDAYAGLQTNDVVRYDRRPEQKVYAIVEEEVVVDEGEKPLDTSDDITKIQEVVRAVWGSANYQHEDVDFYDTIYENPPKAELDELYVSHDYYIGDFKIEPLDVYKQIETERFGFSEAELSDLRDRYMRDTGINLEIVKDGIDGDFMLVSGDKIGDIRVKVYYDKMKKTGSVTIVGRQHGDRIVLEEDDIVEEHEQVHAGEMSRKEFLSAISGEDKTSRVIGTVFSAAGAVILVLSFVLGRGRKVKKRDVFAG